jgi:type I restriction enzyme S subunit
MYLSNDYVKAYAKNVSTGSIHKGIRHSSLRDCKLSLPKKEIIDRFSKKMIPILEKLDLTREETQKLTELLHWLSPMLMNGQVSMK